MPLAPASFGSCLSLEPHARRIGWSRLLLETFRNEKYEKNIPLNGSTIKSSETSANYPCLQNMIRPNSPLLAHEQISEPALGESHKAMLFEEGREPKAKKIKHSSETNSKPVNERMAKPKSSVFSTFSSDVLRIFQMTKPDCFHH